MVQLSQFSHVIQGLLLSRFLSVHHIIQMRVTQTQEERKDMGEDKALREGNQHQESLHRHGILPERTEEQEV